MLIRRAFYREATQSTIAIVAVLVVVLVLFGTTAVLGRAVRGDYAQGIVLQILGWQTLRRLDLLLPLGLYLGVLLTLSRWYRDSEMTVLAACGISLTQLLRPVLAVAGVVALLAAGAAFYLTPLAARAIEQVKVEGANRPELSGITPGAFSESAAGGRILYAESVGEDDNYERVFLSNPKQGRPHIVLARTGYPFVDPRTGDQFMALQDGWAYEGIAGQPDYRVVRFESYAVRLDVRPIVPPPTTTEGLPTRDLFAAKSRDALAEAHWRLSKPLLVMVLAVFALVLAYTDARRGRLANLFVAILVYFIYSNLLGLGQTLVKKGQVPAGVGLWWVHMLMVGIAVYLLYRRNNNRPLLPRLRFGAR